MIYIFKGDSTIFADIDRFLTFKLNSTLDLTGWKAIFKLQAYTKEFDDITSKLFCVNLTSLDTSKFYYGNCFGTLVLIDNNGNAKTICNTIEFNVTSKVIENVSQTIELQIPKCGDIEIDVEIGVKYVTKQELEKGLATKQPIGDYATNTDLQEGLATKQNVGDYPTRLEVNQLIASLPKFKVVVGTRPETGEDMTIYLEPKEGTDNDIYNEYLWVNNAYELLGTTAVDLTDYLTASKLGVANISKPMTEAEYEALTPDENTLYLIKEE